MLSSGSGIGWMPGSRDTRGPATPDEIETAWELLSGRRMVVLTGAGLSTDSGLPDYRGPQAKPRNPMTYDQFVSLAAMRRHYWARNHLGWHYLRKVNPNAGHQGLAELEAAGLISGVITQNVDRLQQRAGSSRVIELHGNYDQVRCLSCAWRCNRAELDERLSALNPGFLDQVTALGDIEIAPDADVVLAATEGFRIADCPNCGGILKPDIVFFGESVPPERVEAGAALVADAEAMLVAGTSLATFSGLRYVRQAARAELPIIIVNRGLTRGDELATQRLNLGTSEAITLLRTRLIG